MPDSAVRLIEDSRFLRYYSLRELKGFEAPCEILVTLRAVSASAARSWPLLPPAVHGRRQWSAFDESMMNKGHQIFNCDDDEAAKRQSGRYNVVDRDVCAAGLRK
jgi:hypothetical protein